ncbi:uncharacterized protein BDZ99DRAFT_469194 [Mytilinidion resinicola]|uniref:Uncharacterized protein n=1 Tax=Mytilinidion resinicola TaxID=574789 RepID=A0A6A6Y0X1_9PEZI|nr:uncharacterized protein BDZ99DRAFT_469194 [Mytilinidion resinicola]KAF2802173.1 hypothetical protein BDZ99DRAFT_469194 [Mytilinidion resinicola]
MGYTYVPAYALQHSADPTISPIEYTHRTTEISYNIEHRTPSQTYRPLSSSNRHHQTTRYHNTRTVPAPPQPHSARQHHSSHSHTPNYDVVRVVPAPTERYTAVPAPSHLRSDTLGATKYTPIAHPVQARSDTRPRGTYVPAIAPRRDLSDVTVQHRHRDGDAGRYTQERRVVVQFDEPRQKERKVRVKWRGFW